MMSIWYFVKVKKYLQTEFRELMDNRNFSEWIDCHVERGSPPNAFDFVFDELEKFVAQT